MQVVVAERAGLPRGVLLLEPVEPRTLAPTIDTRGGAVNPSVGFAWQRRPASSRERKPASEKPGERGLASASPGV